MKLHQHFEFGPASQDPFSFCQMQLALDTVNKRVAVLPVLGYWSELCSYHGLHKPDWLLIKRHSLARRPGTKLIGLHKLIGVILAFTGKKLFYFN
jgi:hypothetical protein